MILLENNEVTKLNGIWGDKEKLRYFGMRLQEVCVRRPGSKVADRTCFAAAAIDTAGCHRDCVLSLASAQVNQWLLISSCRDGTIKVWR
mgnify:CR=1 FL=1